MLNIATAIGLGPSRSSVRLLKPVLCRYASSKSPIPTRSNPTKNQARKAIPSTAAPSSRLAKPVVPNSPSTSSKQPNLSSYPLKTSKTPPSTASGPHPSTPSSKPPPSSSKSSADHTPGPSQTPPPSWTSTPPSTSSRSSSSSPPSSLTRSLTPPPRSPAISPSPPRPSSRPSPPTVPFRDPSKPRNPQRFDWPWEELESDDPDIISEQRIVYSRPPQTKAQDTFSFLFFAFVTCMTMSGLWWQYKKFVRRQPPEREEDKTPGILGYIERGSKWAATSVIPPMIVCGFIWGSIFVTKHHLKPIKTIIQTRSRYRASGPSTAGDSTVTTYLYLANSMGVTPVFMRLFGIKEFREVNPLDVTLRQWGGGWYLVDIHGESRAKWSWNSNIPLSLSPTSTKEVDLVKERSQALVLSESRLRAVFGDVLPARESRWGLFLKRLRSQ